MFKNHLLKCFEWLDDCPTWMRHGGHLLATVWWKVAMMGVWFGLVCFFFFFSGDITQKGYEKKRSKLLQAYLPHTPGNTHTHTHHILPSSIQFYCVKITFVHCVCCRGRAPHPCHTIFIVFLILPLPTSTVHWHKGWTLPLGWDKGHKFTHTHTHNQISRRLCSLCHNSSKQIRSTSSFSESDVIFLKFSLLVYF